jgi:hypothetical protein
MCSKGGSGILIPKIFKSFFAVKPAASGSSSDTGRHQWISNPWHAVAIMPCPKPCRLARNMAGLRFLSKDAPALPLPECTVRLCTCRYRHYQDRRGAPRRASDVVASPRIWRGQERRGLSGRRSTD